MTDLHYELRDDGVLYRLDDGTLVRVRGNSMRSTAVAIEKDGIVVPPETGNLGSSPLRDRLLVAAQERFGDVNGLGEDLGRIAAVLADHLRERDQAAREDASENETPEFAGTPYRILGNGFARIKYSGNGEVPIPLTNFLARVEEEVVRDDGADKTRIYKISGQIGDRLLPRIDVPVSQFPNLRWVAENWGLEAHVSAGQHAYATEAIELYSRDAVTSFRFAHTGWRVLEDDSRVFLHGNGGI